MAMEQDRLQKQRFELKYIIPEAKALAIREFVRCYLDLDEYGVGKPNFSYPVHSLYLDSDQLALYQTTINGDKNRFKLRLRYYTDAEDAPVFFEIKKRTNNTISKERGAVKRSAVAMILRGHIPDAAHLLSKSPKALVAIQRFCQHTLDLRATPKAHIAYLREAWLPAHDNSVRVTLDREVRCEAEPTFNLSTTMIKPVLVFGNEVVLELKFTNRFPDWFRDLVRVFGLMQCGAAKYVDGVTLLGKERVTREHARPEHETAFLSREGAASRNPTREAVRPFA
ncbi:MAG: polyphosphate polymerase domain-containing protein [Verrucomicrobia bacterium]|nr:polyphosphate polymerase domain-containing protein [Verrucomicrobiota bacterium]